MSSEIKADKWSPATGTSATLGDSGDTFTIPTGAGLTVTDEVKTNKISPASGTAFTLGDSGDTFTIPSGATIANSGTATGFGGGNVQPYASVYLGTSQSISDATYTVVGYDTAVLNVGTCMDITSNKGRFTPTTAGVYYISGFIYSNNNTSGSTKHQTIKFSKNGSTDVNGANAKFGFYVDLNTTQASSWGFGISGGALFDMNGSSDYLEVMARFDVSSGTTGLMGNGYCHANVWKLITS